MLLPASRCSPVHVCAETLPPDPGGQARLTNQPRATVTARRKTAGTPASIREPIKSSTAIAIRKASTGLSRAAAAAIDQDDPGRKTADGDADG
jgi:hypothetical protein